jgi:MoxR-like ATPase
LTIRAQRSDDDAEFLADRLVAEIGRIVVGQRPLVDRLMIALLAGGHLLLEGPPGVAKTLVVRTLAQALHLTFQRIQFTPDLLPADLIGTPVYNPHEGAFVVHRGPIFANVILADEINRAPAKVQSALLEVMQEHRVTIGQSTFTLDEPFLVLATQNPLEHEGTYPLPEAQLDRFFMQVLVPYPGRDDEREIIRRHLDGEPPPIVAVAGWPEIAAARAAVHGVLLADSLVDYMLSIVAATRPDGAGAPGLARLIRYGASPRAALHLAQAARAHAFLARRSYVMPEDVKAVAPDVLSHRLVMSYDADGEGVNARDVVRQILDTTAVP